MGGPAGAFTVTRGDTRAAGPQGLGHKIIYANSPFRQVRSLISSGHPSVPWLRQETRAKATAREIPMP